MNSLQRPLDAVPAVPAGTVYAHTIRCVDMTLDEIGFLLATLCAMPALEMGPRIGGGRTAGYGYYTGEYVISGVVNPDDRLWRQRHAVFGKIVLPGDGSAGTIDIGDNGRILTDALAAWESAEDAIGTRFATFATKA